MRELPYKTEEISELCKQYETPFHLYDWEGIQTSAKEFYDAFDWTNGVGSSFKNHYAVKACPNPVLIYNLYKKCNMGMDCSSIGELLLCEKLGIVGDDIMFTSNNTRINEYQKAAELKAIINLDDYSQLGLLKKALGGKLPEIIGIRYNPGPERTGNVFIGQPVEAKYGFTKPQLLKAYQECKENGVKRFCLHTMVASNSLDIVELTETANMLFSLANEIYEKVGVKMDMVNFGGGVGVPYKPNEQPIDFKQLGENFKASYNKYIANSPLAPLQCRYECGRVVTGDFGCLVTRVINMKNTYKQFVGVDACMADLMRPGLYGAYHHITILPDKAPEKVMNNLPNYRSIFTEPENYCDPEYKGEKEPLKYDVVGSLCENNDKFAIDRKLNKEPCIGDICVIHTTGAHAHAMGFQYNAKLRPAEVMRISEKESIEIRRRENIQDYFMTAKFPRMEGDNTFGLAEGYGLN